MEMLTLLGNVAAESTLHNNNKRKRGKGYQETEHHKTFYRTKPRNLLEMKVDVEHHQLTNERCQTLTYQNKTILGSVRNRVHHLIEIVMRLEQNMQTIHLRRKWNDLEELQAILFQISTFHSQLMLILTALQSSRQAVLNTLFMSHEKDEDIRKYYIEYRQHYNHLCDHIHDATRRSMIIMSSLELIFFFE